MTSVAVAGVEGPPSNSLESAWPEVLPTLAGLCQPNSPVALRESGYELMRRLVEAVPDAMLPHHATLLQIMGAGLSNEGLVSDEVHLAARRPQPTLTLANQLQQQPFQVFVPMLRKHCPKC